MDFFFHTHKGFFHRGLPSPLRLVVVECLLPVLMAAPSKNQQEIALLKEQIELEKLKQQLQRQDEIMMLTLQIQKEKEKSMRREEVALKRELDKAIR